MTRRCFGLAAALGVLAVPALAQGPGGPGGPPRPGGFMFGGGGLMGLVRMPEVQKELKLDQTQAELIQGLAPRGPGGFGGFGGPGAPPRPGGPGAPGAPGAPGGQFDPAAFQKMMEQRRAEDEKKLGEILDTRQMKRLKELDVQRAGIRGLERKDIADGLKLTADQRNKVQAALQTERDGMRQAFQGFNPGQPPSEQDRQAMFQKMQANRTATDAKLNAVLTDPQKGQFKAMQGAPFTFPQPRFGPGGFGAPGGRPGGGAPGFGQNR